MRTTRPNPYPAGGRVRPFQPRLGEKSVTNLRPVRRDGHGLVVRAGRGPAGADRPGRAVQGVHAVRGWAAWCLTAFRRVVFTVDTLSSSESGDPPPQPLLLFAPPVHSNPPRSAGDVRGDLLDDIDGIAVPVARRPLQTGSSMISTPKTWGLCKIGGEVLLFARVARRKLGGYGASPRDDFVLWVGNCYQPK